MGNQEDYYVYFYYNENTLLYVGLTNDVWKRFITHQENWMSEVTDIGIKQYPNRMTMVICEKYYIAKLKPKHNIKDVTNDDIDINFSDSLELKYSRKEFKNKYSESDNPKSHKTIERLSYNEIIKNINCNKISSNTIDLFDERILNYNLDETVFLCEDFIFYFNDSIINERKTNFNKTTNTKFEQIKAFLKNYESEERPVLNKNIMPLVLNFASVKCTGGFAIVSSMSINKEGIVTDTKFADFSFLSISKNHLILDFYKFFKESMRKKI